MKTTTDVTTQDKPEVSRRAVLAVLSQFNISPAMFDGLRNDSYEKHIAKRSLAELETVYSELLRPGASGEEIQKKCPPWSKGHKKADKLPSISTLMTIKRRITAEETVSRLNLNDQFLKALKARTKSLPTERQAQIYNAILELLGEELISAKLEGKPLLENLKGVDRMMKAREMAVKERQRDERIKLEERGQKVREEKLEMEQAAEKARERRNAPPVARTEPVAEPKAAEPWDREKERQKTKALMEKLYGKNPYENQAPKN